MADEEFRFEPGDHILYVLISRIRTAERAMPDCFDRYVEWVAIWVFDDPSVAGCVAALLNEDYSYGGAGEDYPVGAATCAVLDLADSERVQAYQDLNDRREWKDELRQRALKHADICRTVNSKTAEQAPGESKEGHPAVVARSPSGNVAPTPIRAVESEHDDYKPAGWFTQHTHVPAPRLRKAARSERKYKKVRTTVIDGRPHYHAGDVKRWWESDWRKPNRS